MAQGKGLLFKDKCQREKGKGHSKCYYEVGHRELMGHLLFDSKTQYYIKEIL